MKKDEKKKLLEEELYAPVRQCLEASGYEVKGEVAHCDVTAIKGELLLIVEMKTHLNLDVILQATLRQRVADIVYIAVPKKGGVGYKKKRWKNICHLLRRLEIGLLLVSIDGETSRVEEVLKPQPFNRGQSSKKASPKRNMIIKEFNSRYGDFNTGGCTSKKLVTAYKEKAIHIAVLLKEHGALSIKKLKEMGTDPQKTAGILQNNHYEWFDRVARGVYSLNDNGIEALEKHKELVEYYSRFQK